MKIFISVPQKTARWFWNINNLLTNSLKDLGHQLVSHEESEIVIAIQHFPSHIKKQQDKKYILLQVEQLQNPNIDVTCYYSFADKIWGFNKDAKREEYLVLGYHPCLETNATYGYAHEIGFFGCTTPRRQNFFNQLKIKCDNISVWDYPSKQKNIIQSKINLNIHSWGETTFTEWDRICLILANKAFLLTENMYCPLPVTQFIGVDDCRNKIKYYLSNEKQRKDISNKLYQEYKTKFDMRKILEEKLKCL